MELFRVVVEVGALDAAADFYRRLLDVPATMHPGARCYLDAGVTVSLQQADLPRPAPKALAFAVTDLDAVFARATELAALSVDDVHGEPAGVIAVRPWGERSFYVDDPWGNQLCFVDATTLYR